MVEAAVTGGRIMRFPMKNNKIWRVLLCLGAFFMWSSMLAGCGPAQEQRTTRVDRNGGATEAPASTEGVVVTNDTATRQLTLRDLGSDIETVIAYDATATMTDRYGQERDGSEIEVGEIIEVKYDPSSGKLLATDIPEDVWEYQEVDDYKFDSDESSLSFADRKYKYTDQTFFSSDGKPIEMLEINKQDVLTVRGTGYNVYSVVKSRGHGYIRLSHYKDFIGGMIEVGDSMILPVTKNMLITVGEGTYKVILSKNHSTAVKNVTVHNGKEVTLDFSDYEPADSKVGVITFDIKPAGADLTINGTAVSYRRPIALAYGVYQVKVAMTGYTTYTGTLDVEEKASTVRIDLVEEKADTTKTTAKPSSTSRKTSTDDTDSTTRTKKMDSDHTITVSAPEGAEVYLDNVYKGLAPCTFTKVIGSQTITLRKDGYTTKSYSVDVLDDDQDVKFSFSDLGVKEETAETTATPAP
ncbi:PEGA domain-containing protein [Clostridium sp. OM07-9AC]|nr:PEGA domain-containing protein [Clostridium sp. OM07-9AC]